MPACSVAQSCLTVCNPVDCTPPGSSVHGILQARKVEWVPMPSSRGSSQPRGRTLVSCLWHWQVDSLSLCHLGGPILLTYESVFLLSDLKKIFFFNLYKVVLVSAIQSCVGFCHWLQQCKSSFVSQMLNISEIMWYLSFSVFLYFT